MAERFPPVIVCCRSDQPDSIVDYARLDKDEVTIGRVADDGSKPDIVLDPADEDLSVSRGCHARIRRIDDHFELLNAGRYGTQLYERRLDPGSPPARLQLFDYFRIPALSKPGKPHYKLLFVREHVPRPTISREPLVPLGSRMVQVYDAVVDLGDKPDAIFQRLYASPGEKVAYASLYDAVWPAGEERPHHETIANALDQHVLKLAKKLRTRRAGGKSEEDPKAHCLLEYKTRSWVRLCLDDVVPALIAHPDRPIAPRSPTGGV